MQESNIRKKHDIINVFKLDKIYIFKHFFDDKEIFKDLVDFYNSELFRFEMESAGARNKVMKTLYMKYGFDANYVENPADYTVMIGKDQKYAQILKDSVDFKETKDARIFIMKDLAAVEDALSLGAKKNES
ncbi:MAG TPA: hypothetical protein C5S50_05445 [Methanosarcinaceae archaeon]|nr:hypothetical protein [Methanosarcinaceae archaeon]